MSISIASSRDRIAPPAGDGAALAGLPHRFGPAPAHNFTVRRDRALRELTEASLCKQLTIIQGPAGAGKTVLLAQWASRLNEMSQRPAWLTMEPSDQDIARFVQAMGDAWEVLGDDGPRHALRAASADMAALPPDAAARAAARIINGADAPLILILDSYETADGPSIGSFLASLAHHCPRLHVALATRRQPDLPIGALRGRNQLFELRPAALHFSAAETKAVMGDLLPELYAHHLHAKTDGLPVAVQFARRALEEARSLGETGSWQDWLDEYYRSEVLDGLNEDLKEIVSRLVTVDRFDLSLARALTDSNVGQAIERLHRVDGILLRDRYGGEYHFPEMLRCFLADRLLFLDPDLRAKLHASAADWFAQRGLFGEALQHAIASGDRQRSLELLERVGGTAVVMQKGVVAARGLLDAMALDDHEAQPIAHLSFAMILAHEGRISEAADVVTAARAHLARRDPSSQTPQHRQLLLVDSFIAGFRDERANPDRVAAVEEALAGFEPTEHDARAHAHTILSWHHYLRGDLALAGDRLDDAAAEYEGSDGIYGSLFIHIHRVLLGFWNNELDAALAESRLAGRLASLFFPEDQRLRILTEILRGSLSFELGEFQPDVEFVELVGLAGGMEGWAEIQLWAHSFAARNAVAHGRLVEARAICTNASEVAARLGTPRLDWNLRCQRVGFETSHGSKDWARTEAAALGLLDASYLDRPELGWQERIGGALTAANLWIGLKERSSARDALAIARRELKAIPIPRFQAMLHICESQLLAAEDPAAARARMKDARACFPGSPSTPLLTNMDLDTRRTNVAGAPAMAPKSDRHGADADPLTLRERQILEYMGEGHPSKVAAYRFGLSEATIKFHLRNIYRKLQAQNRTQALARYRSLSAAAAPAERQGG